MTGALVIFMLALLFAMSAKKRPTLMLFVVLVFATYFIGIITGVETFKELHFAAASVVILILLSIVILSILVAGLSTLTTKVFKVSKEASENMWAWIASIGFILFILLK